MSEEKSHKSYEWAEEFFRGDYEVAPKYRDMLAMVAAKMMGNAEAAQHFYNQALVDGASDAELGRVVEISRSTGIGIGDLPVNVEEAKKSARSESEKPGDMGSEGSQSGVN